MANETKAAPEVTILLHGKRYEFKWTLRSGKAFKTAVGKDLAVGDRIDLLNSDELMYFFWAALLGNRADELTPEYVGRGVRLYSAKFKYLGKEIDFVFSLYSLVVFKQLTKVDLLSLTAKYTPGMETLSAFLYAGLVTENPDLQIDDVDDNAELEHVLELFKQCSRAFASGATSELAGLISLSLDSQSLTEAQKKTSKNAQVVKTPAKKRTRKAA